ncbi:hypothetical protein ARZXY2_4896 (plasmid) [Arthrobacter sp. ZXY-2]|nr:hypothetical protein ARZXY2_4896 [Arthrobacter sp. ZXY-2]
MSTRGSFELVAPPLTPVHITTIASDNGISLKCGLVPRAGLDINANVYANDSLVTMRNTLIISRNRTVSECVPFYINPIQPMFVRLLATGALGFSSLRFFFIDETSLIKNESSGSLYLQVSKNEGMELQDVLLQDIIRSEQISAPWWTLEHPNRHARMVETQRELLVARDLIPLNELKIVSSESGDAAVFAWLKLRYELAIKSATSYKPQWVSKTV